MSIGGELTKKHIIYRRKNSNMKGIFQRKQEKADFVECPSFVLNKKNGGYIKKINDYFMEADRYYKGIYEEMFYYKHPNLELDETTRKDIEEKIRKRAIYVFSSYFGKLSNK